MRVVDTADRFHFLASHYELQSRRELHQLFRYASLSLPPQLRFQEPFVFPIPELESDKGIFLSCVHRLHRDSRFVSRVFSLLGRGQDLIGDKNFSIWNFLKGSASRRQNLLSKLESSYPVTAASPETLCLPTESDPDCRSGSTSSTGSLSPRSFLGRATLAVPRCDVVDSAAKGVKNKVPKGKKN